MNELVHSLEAFTERDFCIMNNSHIRQAVAAVDPDAVVRLSREMIRVPSFSGDEAAVSAWAANAMEDLGFDEVWQSDALPGRPNAYGRIRGADEGPTILFNGHLDTNMVVDGWERDPHGGDFEDGWIFGIGASNMKAGDAALLAGAAALKRSGLALGGDIIVQMVVGELQAGIGTKHALESGLGGDFFINAEPTEMHALTMHAGSVVLRLKIYGETRHYATMAGRKQHAIERAMRLLSELGPCHETITPGGWLNFPADHPYDGLPQFNIGSIRAGITTEFLDWRPALVPDYCEVNIDVRTIPGQSPEGIIADLREVISRLEKTDEGFRVDVEHVSGHVPFEVAEDATIVGSTVRAYTEIAGSPPRVGGIVPQKFSCSDCSFLCEAGIEGIMYGPGGRYVSVPDERVRADDVIRCAQVYAGTVADLWSRQITVA